MLHPKGAFGFECTLDRVIEELKGYNDFALHRVGILPNTPICLMKLERLLAFPPVVLKDTS